jgi:hypothetical protein
MFAARSLRGAAGPTDGVKRKFDAHKKRLTTSLPIIWRREPLQKFATRNNYRLVKRGNTPSRTLRSYGLNRNARDRVCVWVHPDEDK